MKGIIFTEFMELVEDQFGLDVLDEVLAMSQDEGIYTSVGSYDHRSLVKLIVNLSKKTDIDAETLQQVFGRSVFKSLLASIPLDASLIESSGTFQFIKHVETYIHVEVKKLYPEASPPTFNFISEGESKMTLDYQSARCMSHVCFGLIKGCADYFDEEIDISMESISDDDNLVRFNLTKVA
ncbi:guanylate cyclase [Vibrio sp. 10N.286.49.B3]|uniref:heme NO-binding domain-containing protein n=1 Tax=Vibrio sp. 10N.286.49.B3 TaxID=1880855 RepID=UPI000C81BB50|nr:heme NO-binding domain-containing protein [Vibrio sp. 10N.286.49.B3]PMH46576.1 guanylate cyclase [Vibrio sp. 10N.286.49.B3]